MTEPTPDPSAEVARLAAERDAARAELDLLAQRLGERDGELRAARAELEAARADFLADINARAEALDEAIRERDHWRRLAERPRWRDRIWWALGGTP